MEKNPNTIYGTTILCIRKNGETVLVGDGQVSLGSTIIKATADKTRILKGNIIAGFAGSTADAFALFERLEMKLQQHPKQLERSCVELARDWRTDKYLRRLEAMLIVANDKEIFIVSGNGDVIKPEYGVTIDSNGGIIEAKYGVAAIGSGGNYALAAALAMVEIESLDAETVARKAMDIASSICIYTNKNIKLQKIKQN